MSNAQFYVGVLLLALAVTSRDVAAQDFDPYTGDVCTDAINTTTKTITLDYINMNCVWILKEKDSTFVYIMIDSVDIATDDALIVYDGQKEDNKTVIQRSDMYTNVAVFVSQGLAVVELNMTHDPPGGFKGLTLRYSFEECSFQLSAPSAEFRSPHYLQQKDSTVVNCFYLVEYAEDAPESIFGVSFNHMNIDPKIGTVDVALDWKDGTAEDVRSISGSGIRPDLFTKRANVLVNVTFDNSLKDQSAKVMVVLLTKSCSGGQQEVDDTTTLTSPGFPGYYPNNQRCLTVLKAKDGPSLSLTLNTLVLSGIYDSLVVKDGPSRMSRLVGSFRNDYRGSQELLLSSADTLWVEFISDSNMRGPGYSATVKQEAQSTRLWKDVFAFVDLNDLEDNEVVYFQLTRTLDSEQVFVKFKNLSLLPGDVISCYDGLTETDSLIASFRSQDTETFHVFSNGPVMLVKVETSNNATQKLHNFTMVYSGSVNNKQNVNTYGLSGSYELVSNTGPPEKAAWFIHIPDGADNLAVYLHTLNIPANSSVDVKRAYKAGPLARIEAGQNAAPVIYTREPIRVLYSTSSPSDEAPGENVLYLAGTYQVRSCDQTVTAPKGSITSPEFPHPYPLNAQCSWHFSRVDHKLLHFSFVQFNLAKAHSLKVVEYHMTSGDNDTEAVIDGNWTFTGSGLNTDFFGTSHNWTDVNVTFNSVNNDMSLDVGQGFQISYDSIDCGGLMTDASSSLGVTSRPTAAYSCVWVVDLPARVPKDNSSANSVSFTVDIQNYTYDNPASLLLRDGGSAQSEVIAMTLRNGTTEQRLSRSSKLWVGYQFAPKSSLQKGPAGFTFTLKYSTYTCKKDDQCANGLCMLDSWRCNGINECGDGSDEIDCGSSSKKGGGVSLLVFIICLVIVFLLAILLVLGCPRIIKKVRLMRAGSNYDRMGSLPEEA